MTFVITDPCINTKDTACVDVCPVDCIHPRKDEPEFEQATMLYIHPDECIDCGACVPACPVSAIYDSPETTPESQKQLVEAHRKDSEFEASEGVRFLHAWADPKSGKVFCLSEGPNKDAVLRVHKKAGHAADEIYEVPLEVE